MAKPKQKLTDLTIKEGSPVPQGDNPEAHIMIVKDDSDDRTLVRKIWDWVKGDDTKVEKFMTTSEILAEDRFISEFSKLRNAFREAVDMSMWLPMDEMASNMKTSVDEFTTEARKLMGELEKSAPESAETLKCILDDLSVDSDTKDEQGREKFAKAFEALESFSMPKAPATQTAAEPVAQEKEAEMAIEVTKSLEDILAGLPEGEANVITKQLNDATEKATAAEAKADAAVETNKTIAERLAALEKNQERAEYVDMAKEVIGESGMDIESTADSLQTAFSVSKEAGEQLKTVLKAAAAQSDTAALFEEAGQEGHDADAIGGASAEAQLNKIAADIRKENPSLSEVQAFNKAGEQNPELKAQAIGI